MCDDGRPLLQRRAPHAPRLEILLGLAWPHAIPDTLHDLVADAAEAVPGAGADVIELSAGDALGPVLDRAMDDLMGYLTSPAHIEHCPAAIILTGSGMEVAEQMRKMMGDQ